MTSVINIVVSGIGSAAVVVALLYASRQTRILHRQLELSYQQDEQLLLTRRAANDLTLMGHTMALDRIFIEIPELRPYFYDEKAVPKHEPTRAQVLATAELIVDLADSVANMVRLDQLDPEDVDAWRKAFQAYGKSQAVQEMIAADNTEGAWREATIAILRS